jgi:hypothetical protein
MGASLETLGGVGRRLAIAAGILAVALYAGPASAELGRSSRPQAAVTSSMSDVDRQAALTTWARGRFAAAGLDVPTAAVVFESGFDACGGANGRFWAATDKVSICVSSSASERVLRPLVLHELSHAWAHTHLTDDIRAWFVELRGASSWNSSSDPWGERATEHAAVVMAWGLMDVPTGVHHIGDTSTPALTAAFRLLTGIDPINDGAAPSTASTRDAAETPAAQYR